jgi:F-type H+-transporting ATPase subunit gamma
MAGAKEIRSKIASVKSTQKITRAMQWWQPARCASAQERMAASRPYAENMRKVIGHLVQANPEYKHPYLVDRPVKRVGYIVVSSDRGLCGGLNINLFKRSVLVKQWNEQGVEVNSALIGTKGRPASSSRFGGKVDGTSFQHG